MVVDSQPRNRVTKKGMVGAYTDKEHVTRIRVHGPYIEQMCTVSGLY